jgi:hypothetical protein
MKEKRYIINLNNGVVFPYDQAAMDDKNRPEIMECTLEGNVDIPRVKASKPTPPPADEPEPKPEPAPIKDAEPSAFEAEKARVEAEESRIAELKAMSRDELVVIATDLGSSPKANWGVDGLIRNIIKREV